MSRLQIFNQNRCDKMVFYVLCFIKKNIGHLFCFTAVLLAANRILLLLKLQHWPVCSRLRQFGATHSLNSNGIFCHKSTKTILQCAIRLL